MVHLFKTGDRVAFSRNWLRSTGNFTGLAPFARGELVDIVAFGPGVPDIGVVRWDAKRDPSIAPRVAESRVLVTNLIPENRVGLE